MEPRSIERGKSILAVTGLGAVLLQWSRDQLNAERDWQEVKANAALQLQWSRDQLNAESG